MKVNGRCGGKKSGCNTDIDTLPNDGSSKPVFAVVHGERNDLPKVVQPDNLLPLAA